MISAAELKQLDNLANEELRELMAYAAGIHAHRDGDGGFLIATALRRIADRLTGQPRRAA